VKPYYEDEKAGIVIYHGDCREVLPLVAADSVVTDPPYGTESLGGGYGRRQLADPAGRIGHTIANDSDLSVLAEALPAIVGACASNAWLCVFSAPRKRHECESLLISSGLSPVGECVWDKGVPGLGYTIRYSHETAIVVAKGAPEKPASALLSLYRISQEVRAMAGRHPHEKPVEIMSRLVEFACPEGGTVLDPFMGSGATLRAAKNLNRRAIGIEVDERWCEFAAQRLGQEVLFGGAA
jgi:DNA modification methylase